MNIFRAYKNEGLGGPCPYTRIHKIEGRETLIPCGKCLRCRKRKQSSLVGRCVAEAHTQPGICLTLTFNDDHLVECENRAKARGLSFFDKEHWQLENKRLLDRIRYFFKTEADKLGIEQSWAPAYLITWERGAQFNRPHAHACLYGLPLQCWRKTQSPELPFWRYGHIHADNVTPASARYVAGYVTDQDKRPLLLHSRRSDFLGMRYFKAFIDDLAERKLVLEKPVWEIGSPIPTTHCMDRQMIEYARERGVLQFSQGDEVARTLQHRVGEYKPDHLRGEPKFDAPDPVRLRLLEDDDYQKALGRNRELSNGSLLTEEGKKPNETGRKF